MNRIKKIKIEDFRTDSLVMSEENSYVRYMPMLCIAQSTVGRYRISVDDAPERETICKGVYVAPAFSKQAITHVLDEKTGTMSAHWLALDVRINGEYRLEDMFRIPTVLPTEYNREIDAAIEEIASEECNLLRKEQLMFRIVEILVSCSEPIDLRRTKELSAALKWIDQNPAEHAEVKKLSDMCHMSQVVFFRKFKQVLGITSSSYCNRRRIALAMELLETSDMSVTDVGIECGIPDTYYFSKIFKMYTDLAPTAFRSMMRYSK